MSTYYYLVCDKHQEVTDLARGSRVKGHASLLAGAEDVLPDFTVYHRGCPLRVLSEYQDDSYLDMLEWTRDNVEQLASRVRCDE